MSTRIGLRELRQDTRRYVELVKQGEQVEITDHGRLVAVLAPPTPEAEVGEEMLAAGELVAGTGEVDLATWEPAPWPPDVESPSMVLTRMRDEEDR